MLPAQVTPDGRIWMGWPESSARDGIEIDPIVTRRPRYHWVRQLLWTRPWLYRYVNLARGRRDFYSTAFDVCVAGFPRSANSYCSWMLQITQDDLRTKSHHHQPAVALQALQLGKPVLLLIRSPRQCIPSFCIHQDLPADRVIDYYIAFHRIILPYCSRLFLVTHGEITSNFKGVIRRMNSFYGLELNTDFDEAAAKREAFPIIREAVTRPDGTVDHHRLHIPTTKRSHRRAKLRREMNSRDLQPYAAHADHLYARFSALARAQKLALEARFDLDEVPDLQVRRAAPGGRPKSDGALLGG
jgi:hypothetical protein